MATNGIIELVQGDLTRFAADALVNAANSQLAGGGGVDGAIHSAGGPALMEELGKIRRASGNCPTGQAVYTRAGRLPAKYVIHAEEFMLENLVSSVMMELFQRKKYYRKEELRTTSQSMQIEK